MKLSRRLVGLRAAAVVAIPAMAFAMGAPSTLPGPAKAYGVICKRDPYNTQPGTPDFSQCVRALAKGTRGSVSASDAARVACRQATPPLPGREFGNCVSSTKTLVRGLSALHRH